MCNVSLLIRNCVSWFVGVAEYTHIFWELWTFAIQEKNVKKNQAFPKDGWRQLTCGVMVIISTLCSRWSLFFSHVHIYTRSASPFDVVMMRKRDLRSGVCFAPARRRNIITAEKELDRKEKKRKKRKTRHEFLGFGAAGMGKGEFAFYLEGKEKKGKVKACLFEKKKKVSRRQVRIYLENKNKSRAKEPITIKIGRQL